MFRIIIESAEDTRLLTELFPIKRMILVVLIHTLFWIELCTFSIFNTFENKDFTDKDNSRTYELEFISFYSVFQVLGQPVYYFPTGLQVLFDPVGITGQNAIGQGWVRTYSLFRFLFLLESFFDDLH